LANSSGRLHKLLSILFIEEHQGWTLLTLVTISASLYIVGNVLAQLTAVRPLLFYVYVDGEPPPICGLCVLFGSMIPG